MRGVDRKKGPQPSLEWTTWWVVNCTQLAHSWRAPAFAIEPAYVEIGLAALSYIKPAEYDRSLAEDELNMCFVQSIIAVHQSSVTERGLMITTCNSTLCERNESVLKEHIKTSHRIFSEQLCSKFHVSGWTFLRPFSCRTYSNESIAITCTESSHYDLHMQIVRFIKLSRIRSVG